MWHIRKSYPTVVIPLHTYSSEIQRQDFDITLQLSYCVKISFIDTKWFLDILQKLKFIKSLKFENEALLKKKKDSKFLSSPVLKRISYLNCILKKMFYRFHGLSINYIIYTEKYIL